MKELKLEVQQIIEGQIRVARDCNMPDYNLATMIRAELELKGWIVYDGYSEAVELKKEIHQLKQNHISGEDFARKQGSEIRRLKRLIRDGDI